MNEQITHKGIVESSEGDRVVVLIEQTSACAACKSKSHCMAAESKVKKIEAYSDEHLSVGDAVTVYGSRRMAWKAVVLAYVLPFVILIGVAVILSFFVESEAVIGLTAIAALVPYFVILRLFSSRLNSQLVFYATKCR